MDSVINRCVHVVLAMVALAGVALGQGTETVIEFAFLTPAKGKPRPPEQIVCWLPDGVKHVRGVVVAHPMIKELALGERFRKVAAEESLGMVVSAAVYAQSGKETIERMDKLFAEWAQKSGQPQIKGASVFTGGLSASVLWARNVIYGAPERCFGTLHVAGGNLHHAMNDQRKSLAGVPFMAVNGEYESCGPDGGIRPHLGFDTQWYLMGDTMLERRKAEADNLMCLVVIPGKGHTAWNHQLAALFLKKAAQYRLDKAGKCVPLKLEDGWLTDRNVKYPRHEPAPYNDYRGDKLDAFWHLDKEMALAVTQYHKDGRREGQERSLFRPAGTFEALWPLGEPMNPALAGSADEARQYVLKRTGKPALADAIAAAQRTDEAAIRKACLLICYAYDDWFVPLGEAKEYADLSLVQWPAGRRLPDVPLRQVGKKEPVFGRLARPATLDKLLQDLHSKDAKVGWGAAEEVAKLGPAAIPDLVRLMDFGPTPTNARAAAALGHMGRSAQAALPDLRRTMLRGGSTEDEGLLSRKAIEAVEKIERSPASEGVP